MASKLSPCWGRKCTIIPYDFLLKFADEKSDTSGSCWTFAGNFLGRVFVSKGLMHYED